MAANCSRSILTMTLSFVKKWSAVLRPQKQHYVKGVITGLLCERRYCAKLESNSEAKPVTGDR